MRQGLTAAVMIRESLDSSEEQKRFGCRTGFGV